MNLSHALAARRYTCIITHNLYKLSSDYFGHFAIQKRKTTSIWRGDLLKQFDVANLRKKIIKYKNLCVFTCGLHSPVDVKRKRAGAFYC